MNRKNVKFLAIAGMMMALSCGSLLCGNGIVSYEGETGQTIVEDNAASPQATATDHCPSMEMPVLENETSVGNCLTTYTVKQVEPHGTSTEFVSHPSLLVSEYSCDVSYGETWQIIGIPQGVNTTVCHPSNLYMRARCGTCNAVSASSPALIDSDSTNCLYPVINYKTSGMIYSGFDLAGAVWDHGLAVGDRLFFSIAYQGTLADPADCQVEIPWIGTKTSDPIEINGVTFWVRVGPNRVSIRASEYISCNRVDTVFAFGA